MCCGFAIIALLGPRLTLLLWWLFRPAYFSSIFSTIFWPLLGFLFMPWLTLAYLLVAPGGINGFDMVWLVLAVLVDLSSYGGSAYGNRDRLRAK